MSETTSVDPIPELVPEIVIDGVVAKHANPDPIDSPSVLGVDAIPEFVAPILVEDQVIAKHGIAPEPDEAETTH